MHLEIISPDKILFKGEVTSVVVPGETGLLEILNNHAPLITTLKNENIRVKESDGKTASIQVNDGGVVEVLNNKVTILL
ncbi:MAG: ATP synthase F1 subunit epsilon [Bacteroidia bacterium]|jgi:F-type H+-transporting ATPase subunit epsilon|nr:ATP synthase F1 subunit epsilon [Bacteroidia bacterium]